MRDNDADDTRETSDEAREVENVDRQNQVLGAKVRSALFLLDGHLQINVCGQPKAHIAANRWSTIRCRTSVVNRIANLPVIDFQVQSTSWRMRTCQLRYACGLFPGIP